MAVEPSSHEALFEEASALEDSEKFPEALLKWRQVVAEQPTALSLARLGNVAAKLKHWTEARDALKRAIALRPRWPLPFQLLALVYRSEGRLDMAEASLRDSLRLKPEPRVWIMLGDVLTRQGRTDEAKEVLKLAIQADAFQSEAFYLLAQASSDSVETAIPLYQRAIEIDPAYGLARRELGWAYRRIHRLDLAEREVRSALEIHPSDDWAFIYLGNILWAREDVQGAEAAFRQALAVNPGRTVALWCLGGLFRVEGRRGEALQALRQALRANVGDVEATIEYARLLRDAGDVRKANKYLRRVVRMEPANEAALALLRDASD